MQVRILVTGSRDVHPNCIGKVWRTLDSLVTKAALREGTTAKDVLMLVGDARGIDTWTIMWSRSRGIKYKKYVADWDTHGDAAGCLRNTDMVRRAHYCIGFWNGISTGTADAIISSRSKRIPVKVIDIY